MNKAFILVSFLSLFLVIDIDGFTQKKILKKILKGIKESSKDSPSKKGDKKDDDPENSSRENTTTVSGEETTIFLDTLPDNPGFGVYSNFTFEPGNKILFYDDFEKDKLGDFPLKWETSGSGEIVTNSMYAGKWLLLSGRSGYLPSTVELPENYTFEFDMVTNGYKENNAGGALTIAFMNKKRYSVGGGFGKLRINLYRSASMQIQNNGAEKTPRISSNLNQKFKLDTLVHFSIAVNKNRLRIWMDEEKIVDIPSLLVGNMGQYILFEAYEIHPEKGQTVLLSNFKIAESKEDLRSQLLDKGRFSTTGIYFSTDKAVIKPESYAVIKSVADYLKENPDVIIQIIGHTDAQGEESYNQQLSERRAQSVIQTLILQFGIDESRLSATGKGEIDPVDDNTTEKGRANNRRVEFVKI